MELPIYLQQKELTPLFHIYVIFIWEVEEIEMLKTIFKFNKKLYLIIV